MQINNLGMCISCPLLPSDVHLLVLVLLKLTMLSGELNQSLLPLEYPVAPSLQAREPACGLLVHERNLGDLKVILKLTTTGLY